MHKFIIYISLAFVAIVSCADNPNASGQASAAMAGEDATVVAEAATSTIEEAQPTTTGERKGQRSYKVSLTHEGDSAHITELLQQGAELPSDTNIPLFFANHFKGYPYVAYTLDQGKEERLVINTKGLDCTTFVENVLALTVCVKQGLTTFEDFCDVLAKVRYIHDKVAYTSRQHYFTTWIADNLADGLIEDVALPQAPLSAKRKPHVDYMTTHVESYKMLNAHREWLTAIREMEQEVNSTSFTFIPKAELRDSNKYREYIHDGDIIGIVTNKKGLDISHVGLAVWHDDGLHLFNASSLHKKVVDEPMTLYQYLQKQTSSAGIRVVRIK